MKISEIVVFVIYLLFMLGIGFYFFFKSKDGSEKTYFLGGRQMGAWVTALSAGASDMSAWVLMGLPTSIYALGLGQVWIPVGLAIGYTISWIVEAPRLRRFSIVANDSITIPQYLTNRFLSKSKALQVICAVVFLVAYTVYAASSVKACGTLFHTVIGIKESTAMYIATVIIVGYTFLGGFNAVCWTDFFQGMLILAAMLIAPIAAASVLTLSDTAVVAQQTPGFWNAFANWKDIASGLGWGLGYFGMPHILLRFMAIENPDKVKVSRRVAEIWVVISMAVAVLIGVVGMAMIKEGALPEFKDSETIIVQIANLLSKIGVVPALLAGVILAGILASTMSTADSQLLAASSAASENIIGGLFRIKLSETAQMIVARVTLIAISVIGVVIAWDSNSSVFGIVSFAWAGFGAVFGPVMLLSLFWKRSNRYGALAGMIVGGVMVFVWKNAIAKLGGVFDIYELLPAFICGLLVNVIVSLLTPKPEKEITEVFDELKNSK